MKNPGAYDGSLDRGSSRGTPEYEAEGRPLDRSATRSLADLTWNRFACHVTSPRCVRRDMTYYRDQ
jgi:hypothetical protein